MFAPITSTEGQGIMAPRFNAVANGPVGQVLAGPLLLKVKTKFHFTKSK